MAEVVGHPRAGRQPGADGAARAKTIATSVHIDASPARRDMLRLRSIRLGSGLLRYATSTARTPAIEGWNDRAHPSRGSTDLVQDSIAQLLLLADRLMYRPDRARTFAHGSGDPLQRAMTNIADREESGHAGLERQRVTAE